MIHAYFKFYDRKLIYLFIAFRKIKKIFKLTNRGYITPSDQTRQKTLQSLICRMNYWSWWANHAWVSQLTIIPSHPSLSHCICPALASYMKWYWHIAPLSIPIYGVQFRLCLFLFYYQILSNNKITIIFHI